MIEFRQVPAGPGGTLERPLLDVYFDPEMAVPQTCLLDTGAASVRLSAELAVAVGLEMPPEPNAPDVIAGAVRSQVYEIRQRLTIELHGGPVSWEADVSFCDPWPHPFGLLGLAGFFDSFDVLIQARDRCFELTPRHLTSLRG